MKPTTVPNLTWPWQLTVSIGLGWRFYQVIQILQKPKNLTRKRFRRRIRKLFSKQRKKSKHRNGEISNLIRIHSNVEKSLGTHVGYIPPYQIGGTVFTDGSELRREEEQIERKRGGGSSKGNN